MMRFRLTLLRGPHHHPAGAASARGAGGQGFPQTKDDSTKLRCTPKTSNTQLNVNKKLVSSNNSSTKTQDTTEKQIHPKNQKNPKPKKELKGQPSKTQNTAKNQAGSKKLESSKGQAPSKTQNVSKKLESSKKKDTPAKMMEKLLNSIT